MGTINTDRIEKSVALSAPRSRVWRAISNAEEFGSWFGMKFQNAFEEGTVANGHITIPGYEHLAVEMHVVRIEPDRYFSYQWHPFAIDPDVDYSQEPMTLVEFRLADDNGGTLLTITESGFDQIPAARREEAFRMNEGGWAAQAKSIEEYVTKS